MKKNLAVTIIIIISLISSGLLYAWYKSNQEIIISTDNAGNTITEFRQDNILLITPSENSVGKVMFLSGGTTGSGLIANSGYSIVINGGYFGYTNTAKTWFIAAGLLQEDENWYTKPFLSSDLNDPNLTHTILFQHAHHRILFSPLTDKTMQDYRIQSGEQLFVAGPMIIDHNRLASGATSKQSHRQGRFPRTVIIYEQYTRKVYYLISPQGKTLEEIASLISHLQHKQRFFSYMKDNKYGKYIGKNGQRQSRHLWSITAINLDGWPSTMLTSKDIPQYNYRSDKLLPFFIGL